MRIFALALLGVAASALAQQQCPAIGALRWDAWHGKDSGIGRHEEQILAPSEWNYRIPFCGRKLASGEVEIECDNAQAMAQEIEYARAARITYWAFQHNPVDNPLSLQLKYYLQVPAKDRINFALISAAWKLTPPEVTRVVKLMQDPSYQKVQSKRPLLYISRFQRQEGEKDLGAAIDRLRAEAKAAGLAEPYIVAMEFNPERAAGIAKQYGFDAISTYTTRTGKAGAPYANLARGVERYWERSKATGVKVVPIVMTGWDNRPRKPAPSKAQMRGRPERLGMFHYEQAKPEEIGRHVASAIRWVRDNPGAAADSIIIYAWNEFSEGGWLAPTLAEGPARVQAMGAAVAGACRSR
jgi:hypothetical protein